MSLPESRLFILWRNSFESDLLVDFRKVALATWNRSKDPSTYGELDLPLKEDFQGSPLAFCVYRIARSISQNPEINGLIRWRKIIPRKSIDITIMVHVGPGNLQFLTIRECDKKSLEQIKLEIKDRSLAVRNSESKDLGNVSSWIKYIPRLFLPLLLSLYDFLVIDLNLNLKWLGLPKNPFGSVVVSNLGTFGIRRGFVPLVPLTRSNLFVTIGQTTERLVLRNGVVQTSNFIPLGITFDHRVVDGHHIGKLAKSMLSED